MQFFEIRLDIGALSVKLLHFLKYSHHFQMFDFLNGINRGIPVSYNFYLDYQFEDLCSD